MKTSGNFVLKKEVNGETGHCMKTLIRMKGVEYEKKQLKSGVNCLKKFWTKKFLTFV